MFTAISQLVENYFWEVCNVMHCRTQLPSMNRDRSVSNPVTPRARAAHPEMSSSGARRPTRSWQVGNLGSAGRFVPVFPGPGVKRSSFPTLRLTLHSTTSVILSFAEIIGRLWSSTRNWRPGSSSHQPCHYSALDHATTTTRPMMSAEPSLGGYPARSGPNEVPTCTRK